MVGLDGDFGGVDSGVGRYTSVAHVRLVRRPVENAAVESWAVVGRCAGRDEIVGGG